MACMGNESNLVDVSCSGKQLDPFEHLLPSKLFGQLEGEIDCPEEFLCPIAMEKMKDPVIASDGHVYDRASIQRSFDSGNLRSPLTNKNLVSQSLTPNLALKSGIEKWTTNNYGTKGLEKRIILLIKTAVSTELPQQLHACLDELLDLLSRYDVLVPELERNVKSLSRKWKNYDTGHAKLAELKELCENRRKSIHSRHVSFRRSTMKVVHLNQN